MAGANLQEGVVQGGPSYLALSWRIDSSQPYLVGPSKRIFDFGSQGITKWTFTDSKPSIITSDGSKEYAKDVSMKLGLSGHYGFAFSGAAEASFSSMSSSKFKQFRLDNFILSSNTHVASNTFSPWASLCPAAQKFLLNAPVDQIHSLLGDFYATETTLGGVFQETVIMEWQEGDTKSSLQTKVEASFSDLAASAKASLSGSASVAAKVGDRDARVQMRILGGDPSIWLGLTSTNQHELHEQWAKSINPGNLFPINLRLVPLWQLLEDESANSSKAAELQQYMMGKWNAESANIPVYHVAQNFKAGIQMFRQNMGCTNYKINGKWTRTLLRNKTLNECSSLCQAAGACNLFSVMISSAAGNVWCAFNAPHECRLANPGNWGVSSAFKPV